MRRERMLQVALGLVGLVYVAMIYPLYTDLAHSKWLLEMKDACEPMFLSCCPGRRHRGNFAGTHTGKTKAERTRYPITAQTSLFHSRQRLFVVP